MADETIRVVGIEDLRTALRQVDKEAPRELAGALADVSRFVAGRAAPKLPAASGAARKSLKPRKTQRGASLAIGGAKVPYGPWLNFGGRVGRDRSVVRPIVKPDYAIYRTLGEESDEVRRRVDRVLETMAQRAGFETEGKG